MSGFVKYLLFLLIPSMGLGQDAIKRPSNLKAAQPSNIKGGKRLTISAFKLNRKSGGTKNTLTGSDSKAPRTKRQFLSKLYGKNVYKNNTGMVESGVLSGYREPFNKDDYGDPYNSSLTVKGNKRVKEKRVIASWFKKGDVYKENVGAVEEAAFTVKGNEPVRIKRKLASRFSKKPKYKYSQSAIADALSSKPESKKKKEKRFKQTRAQKDLFEPGILKTSKFPRD